jgi:hypothetical protein
MAEYPSSLHSLSDLPDDDSAATPLKSRTKERNLKEIMMLCGGIVNVFDGVPNDGGSEFMKPLWRCPSAHLFPSFLSRLVRPRTIFKDVAWTLTPLQRLLNL